MAEIPAQDASYWVAFRTGRIRLPVGCVSCQEPISAFQTLKESSIPAAEVCEAARARGLRVTLWAQVYGAAAFLLALTLVTSSVSPVSLYSQSVWPKFPVVVLFPLLAAFCFALALAVLAKLLPFRPFPGRARGPAYLPEAGAGGVPGVRVFQGDLAAAIARENQSVPIPQPGDARGSAAPIRFWSPGMRYKTGGALALLMVLEFLLALRLVTNLGK